MHENRPDGYPNTVNSGIYDAQAFRIGDASGLVHKPYLYPNGNKVVARCGQYGYVVQSDGFRTASWADSDVTCNNCKRLEDN